MSNIETPIICALVADDDRANFLPKFLGFDTLIFELTTYHVLSEYCPEYKGGYWVMWELSNGGFYMSPGRKDETYSMSCAGNYFDGVMTADAAGIVACLVALSRMLWRKPEEKLNNLFYRLRDWAGEHPEADKIFAAID